eukprot:GHVU01234814.1.p1 GENE.GHVU01234814.1~~GHVU01234814.1.p1  ORF type:complete len:166 (+),score=27.36 GHVU01234814.1:43-498(+)
MEDISVLPMQGKVSDYWLSHLEEQWEMKDGEWLQQLYAKEEKSIQWFQEMRRDRRFPTALTLDFRKDIAVWMSEFVDKQGWKKSTLLMSIVRFDQYCSKLDWLREPDDQFWSQLAIVCLYASFEINESSNDEMTLGSIASMGPVRMHQGYR